MVGSSPDPGPAGDWGVKLRGSLVRRILQPQLWFNRLSGLAHFESVTQLVILTRHCGFRSCDI